MKKFLQRLVAVAFAAMAWCAFAKHPLVVTATDSKEFSPESEFVTLRNAIHTMATNAAAVGPDGTRTITFDVASSIILEETLVVPEGTKPFAIDGFNAGRGVRITTLNQKPCTLFNVSSPVTFRNLTLTGRSVGNYAGGFVLGSGTGSAVVASNCLFSADATTQKWKGFELKGTVADNLFSDCTFMDCVGGDAAAFETGTSTSLKLVNCTFNAHGEGAADTYPLFLRGRATILFCTFANKHQLRFGFGKTHCIGCVFGGSLKWEDLEQMDMVGCSYAKGIDHPALANNCREDDWSNMVTNGASATDPYSVGLTAVVGTVTHTFLEPLACEAMTVNPPYVWHNADWSGIAYSFKADASAADLTQIGSTQVGTSAPRIDKDQLGQTVAVHGRGAVRTRYWQCYQFDSARGTSVAPITTHAFEGLATVPVPTRKHCTFRGWWDARGQQAYDGKGKRLASYKAEPSATQVLTARWTPSQALIKVTSEADGWNFLDDPVTLREALAALQEFSKAELSPRKIAFADTVSTLTLTNALALADAQAADGRLVLDGWRAGKTLALCGDGKAHGLLEVTGPCVLSNLTVRSGHKDRRAVTLKTSAAGLCLLAGNCAFEGNAGGAVSVADLSSEAAAVFRNCSFHGNGGASGAGLEVKGTGAAVSCVHCTFGANTSTSGGAAATVSAGGGAVLFANCTFVGNAATGATGVGALDVEGAKVFGCVFAGNTYGSAGKACGLHARGTQASELAASSFADGYDKASGTPLSVSDDIGNGSATALFRDGTTLLSTALRGVTHHYAEPASKSIVGYVKEGWLIWLSADGRNLAASKTRDGAKTALIGAAASATVCCGTDELDLWIANPMRGAVTEDVSRFQVTRADDADDPSDGRTTLRQALESARRGRADPGPDGFYEITFGDALFAAGATPVTVALDDKGTVEIPRNVRIRGRAGVTVQVATGSTALYVQPGAKFELKDLTVDFKASVFAKNSSGQPTSGMLVKSEGNVTLSGCAFSGSGLKNGVVLASFGTVTDFGAVIEECSFTGSKCGTLTLLGLRSYRLVNCTFANITATDNNGTVHLAGANTSVMVSCTVCNCKTAKGGLYLEPSLVCRPCVVNTLAVFNTSGSNSNDIQVNATGDGWAHLYHVGTVKRDTSSVSSNNCFVVSSGQENALFAGALRSVAVGGARRWYRPLSPSGQAKDLGCYVFHDAAWTNVVCRPSLKYQMQGTNVVVGTLTRATDFLGRDIATRPVAQLPTTYQEQLAMADVRAVPGSYAALTDIEAGAAGAIAVNSPSDSASGAFNPYDGTVTLREAVAYANAHPEWRDADGNCTLTFDSGFFGNVRERVWTGAQRQIEITGVTNGLLVVRGPADGRKSVTFDGSAKHRLFVVGAGNRVRFENVSFAHGSGQVAGGASVPSGGAILNAGTLTVANANFKSCAGGGATSSGGALHTESSATTRVERCTFADCAAGRGGALSVAAGGVLTAVATTFLDNAAEVQCGGAAHVAPGASRAAFVGCTFTRNRAATQGGAVACEATASRTLFLIDCLLVGNAAGMSGADLESAGETPMVGCWYGERNADRLWNQDVSVKGGVVPADVFSRVSAAGAAVPYDTAVLVVPHQVFPLTEGKTYETLWVRHDADWTRVGYCEESAGEVTTLYGDWSPARLQLAGELLQRDQIDGLMSPRAALGAVSVYETPQGRLPVSEDDPLAVTTPSLQALKGAIAHAVQHPNLASNGYFTITFLPGLTIPFDETVDVAAFTSAGLRLVGPVTFDGQSAVRLFKLASGNRLRLENVTLANGFADGKDGSSFGGAVYAKDARLEASNCVFRACRAGTATAQWAYGGAVEYWDGDSGTALASGDFTDCRFEDCAAVGKSTTARILYRASAATALRGCRFNGSDTPSAGDVMNNLRARIDRVSGAEGTTNRLYFGTLSAALAECCRGDTLVRLDKNVEIPSDLRWPEGVSFVDETELGDEKAKTLLAAARANLTTVAAGSGTIGSEPLYCVRETPTRVLLALNERAVAPDLSGPGAEVDLGGSETEVSVVPATVVPGLWYGLGCGATPAGPYAVPSGGWVRAETDGLPHALTAPKSGASGYYRVMVRE